MPLERMVQYVKDGTEAFDGLFPVGKRRLRSRSAFESLRSWPSAFMSMRNFASENDGLPKLLLEWREDMLPWLNATRPVLSHGRRQYRRNK